MGAGSRSVLSEIQRAVSTQDPIYGTPGAPTWTLLVALPGSPTVAAPMWAEWQDVLPSRDERLTQGVVIASRRSRVRFGWWDGWESADTSMQIVKRSFTTTTWQIVGGPVLVEATREIEFFVEKLST